MSLHRYRCISIKSNYKNLSKSWKFLKTYLLFDFSNLNENHELFSRKNKKVIVEFKIETLKYIWVDEFICLRSKHYSFNCKDDIESKNNLKGISKSQSKLLQFEE